MIPGIVAGRAVTPAPVDPVALSIYNKLAEWWTCDSLSGGNLVGQHASTGLNNLNSPTTTSAKIGNGVDLELSSSQGFYSDGAAPGTYTTSSATSMCLWCQPESLGASQSLIVLQDRTTNAGALRRMQLRIATTGELVGHAGDGSAAFTATTSGSVGTGSFVFLQGDVVPGGSVRARINNGTWATATGPSASSSSSLSVRVGLTRRTVSVVNETFADGVLDEVAIFDDKLTDSEWDYLYNGGAGLGYAALKAAAGF